ncbi:MAG: hypothetical protein HYY24_24030 [Verrucomicrobia bacterium]|nr:hypothetical protein [Verrucomicrobiota bacterium]
MKSSEKFALLARAAHRASVKPDYLAWVFARYADAERKTDEELAGLIGASMIDLRRLRLCLIPRSESFAADVQQIARMFGLDAGRLAKMIRHVEALQGMADDREAEGVGEVGLLMAARARGKKQNAPTKRKEDDLGSK